MWPAPPTWLQRRQRLALTAGLWLLPAHATVREHRVLFGGPVDLLLDERVPRRSVATVRRGLEAMSQRWSAWKPGDVTAVNQAFAAGRAVRPTSEVWSLIQGAAALQRPSCGFFNAALAAWWRPGASMPTVCCPEPHPRQGTSSCGRRHNPA